MQITISHLFECKLNGIKCSGKFLSRLNQLYQGYVSSFFIGGKLPLMMDLKLHHTLHVVENAALIAQGESWDENLSLLGQAAALLHDTGRYSQLKEFGTFRDQDSTDHARRSHDIVLQQGWLAPLPSSEQLAILTAVLLHSQKTVELEMPIRSENDRDLLLKVCHIVRDADKLDIFRVLEESAGKKDLERHPEIAWGLPAFQDPNPEVIARVCSGQPVDYSMIHSLSDFVLVQVGWMVSGLCYATSRRLTKERNHLEFRRTFLKKLSDSPEIDRACDLAGEKLDQ